MPREARLLGVRLQAVSGCQHHSNFNIQANALKEPMPTSGPAHLLLPAKHPPRQLLPVSARASARADAFIAAALKLNATRNQKPEMKSPRDINWPTSTSPAPTLANLLGGQEAGRSLYACQLA
ncbi:hypothetical protein AWZ03_012533 [Drosophila navojoa]|uniref:Uncharacterized protein n=1 Tax=Drosophila navojoa TaxID=7232 RepID=A0A484AXB9_DRONA|nr:hypothetical protein AWZ03_012533 [Drosophila navojoa]